MTHNDSIAEIAFCELCADYFTVSFYIDNTDSFGTNKIFPLLISTLFVKDPDKEKLPDVAFFSPQDSNVYLCVKCAPDTIIWGGKIYRRHTTCELFYLYAEDRIILGGLHTRECPNRQASNSSRVYNVNLPTPVPMLIRRSQLDAIL